MDLSSNHPIARAIRFRRSELCASVTPELKEAFASERPGYDVAELAPTSYVVVPVVARRQAIGALFCAMHRDSRKMGLRELAIAEDLARSIALAIESARALRNEQREREQAERLRDRALRLQSVTAALSEALTCEDAAIAVVREAVAALGAATGAVAKLCPLSRELTVVHAEGVPEDVRAKVATLRLDDPLPACDAARTRRSVFIETTEARDALYPHLASMHERVGNGAFAAVPLIVEGRVLAVLGLTFHEPRDFPPDDREFILTLARQCAQAFERARLFGQLTDAVRARDEALAVVSHDLRNPMSSVRLMTARLQRSRGLNEEDAKVLHRIDRAVQRMDNIVSQLLEVAKFESGQVSLVLAPCEVIGLLEGACDAAAPQAADAGVALSITNHATEPLVCDRGLVLRMLDNLIGNALKFTPRGGHVGVGAERRSGEVHLWVSDDGRGVAAEHLPHLFDRYWQLRETAHLGSGLGLSIVKSIVRAHAGRVEVESELGRGTTFHVWLKDGVVASGDAA
jgi:signal transduction histidine kinase